MSKKGSPYSAILRCIHTQKNGVPTLKNMGKYAKNRTFLETRSGQGQHGHSYSKMVCGTSPSQDAPTHQILNPTSNSVGDMLRTQSF